MQGHEDTEIASSALLSVEHNSPSSITAVHIHSVSLRYFLCGTIMHPTQYRLLAVTLYFYTLPQYTSEKFLYYVRSFDFFYRASLCL